ncbi:UDP-N-acetylglucosamine diphosphorylase/glucosamine-1-phosphate N-acetyltransferase [Mangrovimicrobium sediminis]|uniref:Bifunctional protein GlmU n=1 Tax=Mangrovimicrobium sediminis TaxID=2562682 RepID=A0A4Z0LZG0_9GAMM|nr:bifunctional UDP-N-acetylglucosamine diphosphorylase/glucosamine-1-phosphate N-acetyltransferase GlmU [Haliea sp. SAOS-164]TGD72773.1 UDP-N-acetylglucosamine diphosphorylase/glucosamine-1-phosphate N-acetyltransferase [Haliea sp. SAOS-164]
MNLEVIILAAGQGTRMRSPLPKVLHPVAGQPMLAHVVATARRLQPQAIHVVVGHGAPAVREALPATDLHWVEQAQQLGTGHAVLQALPDVDPASVVLVLYGDVPLIGEQTLSALVAAAHDGPALLTARLADPGGYGRILRGADGAVLGVVEQRDATDEQLAIDEVNTGVIAAPAALLARYLPQVGNANSQGEYYLPDVLGLAVADGIPVAAQLASGELEILGVNDRLQLARVEREYQLRRAQELMREGVAIADPARFDTRGELRCGAGVSIDINCLFEGEVVLGDGVQVGPNCVLKNVRVADGATIHAMSHLEDAEVGAGASVGPFARLRPGTRLARGSRVGNFVETKNAQVGEGSKINHLSYVGDCEMGAGVNIGAGTITCNYDGVSKHRTSLGDDVFIGSNSTLVAPVSVARGGFVAAGSTLTQAVAEGDLAVGRSRQRNISGWRRPGKRGGED